MSTSSRQNLLGLDGQNSACLLLGSNIEPRLNLPDALDLLRQYFQVEGVSATYETPAVGSAGPNFHNAALLVLTQLAADALKTQVLRPIEARLGRVRSADKNSPRTIDIDIVAWNGQLEAEVWKTPHQAVPVADLLPGLIFSESGETLAQVARRYLLEATIERK